MGRRLDRRSKSRTWKVNRPLGLGSWEGKIRFGKAAGNGLQ